MDVGTVFEYTMQDIWTVGGFFLVMAVTIWLSSREYNRSKLNSILESHTKKHEAVDAIITTHSNILAELQGSVVTGTELAQATQAIRDEMRADHKEVIALLNSFILRMLDKKPEI